MEYTIYQGVLNDDYITKEPDGQYKLVYYTYANEWSNHGYELTDYNLDYLVNFYKATFGDRLREQAKYDGVSPDDEIDAAFGFFSYECESWRVIDTPARGAWHRGVALYATELLDSLPPDEKPTRSAFLNGAKDWREYSLGGCAFIYDKDIAERLCSPSELKRTHGGELAPNKSESWLDVQARALYQACEMIMAKVEQ